MLQELQIHPKEFPWLSSKCQIPAFFFGVASAVLASFISDLTSNENNDSSSPIPDVNLLLTEHTVASKTGLCVVLCQEMDREEHPMMHISRKLNPAEMQYVAVRQKALVNKSSGHRGTKASPHQQTLYFVH